MLAFHKDPETESDILSIYPISFEESRPTWALEKVTHSVL